MKHLETHVKRIQQMTAVRFQSAPSMAADTDIDWAQLIHLRKFDYICQIVESSMKPKDFLEIFLRYIWLLPQQYQKQPLISLFSKDDLEPYRRSILNLEYDCSIAWSNALVLQYAEKLSLNEQWFLLKNIQSSPIRNLDLIKKLFFVMGRSCKNVSDRIELFGFVLKDTLVHNIISENTLETFFIRRNLKEEYEWRARLLKDYSENVTSYQKNNSYSIFRAFLLPNPDWTIEIICGQSQYKVPIILGIITGFLLPLIRKSNAEKHHAWLVSLYKDHPDIQRKTYEFAQKQASSDSRWESTLQKMKAIKPHDNVSTVCETVAAFVEYLQLNTKRDEKHYHIIWKYVIPEWKFKDIERSIQQAHFSLEEQKAFWSKGLNIFHGTKNSELFVFLTRNHPDFCHQYVKRPSNLINLQDKRVKQWIKENDFNSYKLLYR